MELLVLGLFSALIFLWIKYRSLKSEQEATIKQQIEEYSLEISALKDALKETERKLDFYKNIKDASAKLNEPSNANQKDDSQLDPEQTAISLEIENTMHNFFITGKAGTGKSFLLDSFRNTTAKDHIILAPTGIAALNVGGMTLHSVFGYFNLVNLNVNEISIKTIRLKSEKQLVLKHISTIIIDEISMVRADTFDKIDRILKSVNDNNLPFGGKQLLLFGDLFQLPPIVQATERDYLYDHYGGAHFFYADAFRNANFQFRELTINHRQKKDADYFELLNRVRNGAVTENDIAFLNTRVVRDYSIYDRFTTLLPTKAEVERINRDRIRQLDSKEYIYHASIIRDEYPNKNHTLEKIFPIVNELHLKKGALVMMVVNDPSRRYVNGTLGIVSDLSNNGISVAINSNVYDIPRFEFSEQEVTYENGTLTYKSVLTVAQYPIVPAYAITIHKSQGQTYQNIVCDINRCFAVGQAYVALSRCSSLSGLHLTNRITPACIQVDRNVLDFYRKNFPNSSEKEPTLLMEASNGMLVRIPESKLEDWQRAQNGDRPPNWEEVKKQMIKKAIEEIYNKKES